MMTDAQAKIDEGYTSIGWLDESAMLYIVPNGVEAPNLCKLNLSCSDYLSQLAENLYYGENINRLLVLTIPSLYEAVVIYFE